tara:strand:- start:104 stop:976 length:873 start_codon:yes stop_codon:yes gene_type:complete
MKYDLVVISQFTNLECIYDLIDSLKIKKKISIYFVLLNQTGKSIHFEIGDCEIHTHEILLKKVVSSSRVRNIGIEYVNDQEINYEYILFPDDDCFFDVSLFQNYFTYLKGQNKNFLLRVTDPINKDLYYKFPANRAEVKQTEYHFVMTSNLVVCYESMKEIVGFDEKLGIGAKYCSTEDYEFFLRVSQHKCFYFLDDIKIFHPLGYNKKINMSFKKTMKRIFNYSIGYIYVLTKYKMYLLITESILKAFFGSFYYLIVKMNAKLFIIHFMVFFYRIWLFFKFFFKKKIKG